MQWAANHFRVTASTGPESATLMAKIIVDPMGVEMPVECSVKTAKCTWPKNPKVTPVWQRKPKTLQINVCKACLDEKIRLGEWELQK